MRLFQQYIQLAICLLSTSIATSLNFLPNTPGFKWELVGQLNMTDPTQQCPDAWQLVTSPVKSCGRKSDMSCDSVNISTSRRSYKTVCGRFRGYQIGSPDAFYKWNTFIDTSLEVYYVDGISITYGSPGNRHHVFTYAAGLGESTTYCSGCSNCPCAGGTAPPDFVGSDYICESGNPGTGFDLSTFWNSDPLWDGQNCGGSEIACCNDANLPLFCKTFQGTVSEDLEVRLCTDQSRNDENVAIDFFELYIQTPLPSANIIAVFNSNNTLHHLEVSWVPLRRNETLYTVVATNGSNYISLGVTNCTSYSCIHYIQNIDLLPTNCTILLTSTNGEGTIGSQFSAKVYGPMNIVIQNTSVVSYDDHSVSISCSFLNSQSFYCGVCCSTDPYTSSESYLYNISTIRGPKVTVYIDGFKSGEIYYCKAAAMNTSNSNCTSQPFGGVKMIVTFIASSNLMVSTPAHNASYSSVGSTDIQTAIGVTFFITFIASFCFGVLVTGCVSSALKKRSNNRHDHNVTNAYEDMDYFKKLPVVESKTAVFGSSVYETVEVNQKIGTG